MENTFIPSSLLELRKHFVAEGRDIRLVGGVVRDLMQNTVPHDIDLCTDAFPSEQLAIYEKYGIHSIPTGAQHGTYTVVLADGQYEITSLRTEREHDGRHAVMTFSRDWVEDLSRRDLTINAMSMTFDGELIDPFKGAQDLKEKLVRFVGDPQERIREDYLRVFRYFRFLARMGSTEILPSIREAITNNLGGIPQISVERIWVELKKLLAEPNGGEVFRSMVEIGVLEFLGINYVNADVRSGKFTMTNDPVIRFGLAINRYDAVGKGRLSETLKLSADEVKRLKSYYDYAFLTIDGLFYHAIVEGEDPVLLSEAARMKGQPFVAELLLKPLPKFPITGKDLIAQGETPGPGLGIKLRELKDAWFRDGCK